ncbi:MAG: glycoside hydrolase family 13 protein [Lachnospiraceae bacterium]|nr:glycoside hydrolase family 13 protein [Lachnospiraceae bacterium]
MANINLIGLHSDETEGYHSPLEPEAGDIVRIRFRTAKDDADEVVLICGNQRIILEKETSTEVFDYYITELVAETETIRYYFEVHKGGETVIYNRRGAFNDIREQYQFAIVPGFKTPDWAKGAVMYQIYTDRFCNGNPDNDVQTNEYYYINDTVKKVDDWSAIPATLDVGRFYGGDLQGVWDKLDYLQGLGVEVLYFNPLFVSPSNHKYDCQDYEHIDPHLTFIKNDGGNVLWEGCKDNMQASKYIARTANLENLEASNEFFARFCEELHRRGMKIIIDGVFNHSGSFNKWMDRERIYEGQEGFAKGAFVDKESPYHTFYQFNEDKWPYNKSYDGWWSNDTLPKLNYESSPILEDYIIEIGKKWVAPPYCVDGWRLDVAADLGHSAEYNHHFWKRFRKAVKEVNPDVMIYAEHYGDASSWMQGDQWDTVMNYDAFMEPLTWFMTGMEKHSDSYKEEYYRNGEFFNDCMSHHMTAMHMPSLMTAMNQLSNHDHSRFLTRTNRKAGRLATAGAEAAEKDVKKSIMEIAVAFQMTWIGAPTLYYGDEAGVCGFTDPDNRRTYPWGKEDFELIEFHRDMIAIHRRNPVLKFGSTKILKAEKEILAFARFDEKSQMVTVINMSDKEQIIKLPVWTANVPMTGIMERLMKVTEERYNVGRIQYAVNEGMLELRMDPMSCKVLRSVPPVE